MLSVSDISSKGLAVGTLTSPTKPGDIIAFDLKSPAAIKQLTAVNDDVLAGKKLGELHEIWYPSVDGMKIQGWYITPPDFDPSKKYPMQLHIHGGPHSMYGVGFNFGWQEHAANDYVILYTNPRGSTGYGSAFGNAIMRAYPGKDYDDLMAGVDTVLAKGFVDEQNMFVTGCSGGGVLTAWIVGKTEPLRGRLGELPRHRLAEFRRHHGRRELVLQLREAAVGGSERAHQALAADVRRQRQDADDADDGGERSADADAADRAVLQRAQAAQGADRDDPLQRRMARHDRNPSNFMRTQLYLRYWFEKHKRPSGDRKTTSAGEDSRRRQGVSCHDLLRVERSGNRPVASVETREPQAHKGHTCEHYS